LTVKIKIFSGIANGKVIKKICSDFNSEKIKTYKNGAIFWPTLLIDRRLVAETDDAW